MDRHNGKPLNSPNDIVVHSSGAIFFTDPPYGIDPDPGEQGFNGVYRVDTDGTIALLSQSMNRPNGLALSIDETLLYVDDSRNRHVLAYPWMLIWVSANPACWWIWTLRPRAGRMA